MNKGQESYHAKEWFKILCGFRNHFCESLEIVVSHSNRAFAVTRGRHEPVHPSNKGRNYKCILVDFSVT